ncbi:dephospho-CoA kinase [Floricoccus tropicus]|uniref:Dephospho-CoA kinase n=1 Tax=Floricoccus tropicus TaxID=1859473 RepID=A0A1E8GR59_9LACT|nr:dephospho-CoA kinase [Floricoccus tropicus]OFI50496.1 dephospho-CoA kinase [Floricoccus tropicus]
MTKVIGITGGIATGKSTVSNFLKENGYQLIDADEMVHELQEPEQSLYNAIKENFGPAFFNDDKSINRQKLSDFVFSNPENLAKLSEIQNRVINEELENRRNQAVAFDQKNNGGNGIIFMDIPLLFEGNFTYFDEVWLVYVPFEIQLKRLMARNDLSDEQARSRIESQMSIEEKKLLTDKIIDNSASIENTKEQIKKLLKGSGENF